MHPGGNVMADNQQEQGRKSSVSNESQAQQPESTQSASQGRETPASANPDHINTKVTTADSRGRDSSVAATEEEKGGSSE
jgi:hypothetical protein